MAFNLNNKNADDFGFSTTESELDRYGVWVKNPPQDIKDDAAPSNPEGKPEHIQEDVTAFDLDSLNCTSDFAEQPSDSSEEEGFTEEDSIISDNFVALDDTVASEEFVVPQNGEASSENSALLQKIASELAGIRRDISLLKGDIMILKTQSNADTDFQDSASFHEDSQQDSFFLNESEETQDTLDVDDFLEQGNSKEESPETESQASGFFEDDNPDETIALSSDELQQILDNSDFSDDIDVVEEEEPSALSSEELQQILDNSEFASETSDGETIIEDTVDESTIAEDNTAESIETDTLTDSSEEEPMEMDVSFEDADAMWADLPNEIDIPKASDDAAPVGIEAVVDDVSSIDFDFVPEESAIEDSMPENFFLDETVIEEPVLDEPNAADTPSVAPIAFDEDAESGTPDESINLDNGGLRPDLQQDIKSVLSYMDQLLENLPDEKIAEFARSEHFDKYKKIFKELGLS